MNSVIFVLKKYTDEKYIEFRTTLFCGVYGRVSIESRSYNNSLNCRY